MNHSLYLLPAALVALFLLERRFPLRRAKSPLGTRLLVNAIVSALALATALIVVQPVATRVLQLVTDNDWGLTQLVSESGAAQALLAFLLLDLSFYYWHRANHAWPLLWRFHNAHHIDPPRMHGIHHSKRFDEINSNWSSVFSWWDRLHGTLCLNVPQGEIDIGVAGYSLPQDNRVLSILVMPFRTQRAYWRNADGQEL